MKTFVQFLKNFLMFLVLPFTWWKIESCGRIGLGFDTMYREKYERSYASSVLEPLMLYIGFSLTTLLSFVVHELFIGVFIWLIVLIPIINRSYEAMNWRDSALFSKTLREDDLSCGEINKRVREFLVHNLALAIRNRSNKKFNHLEHVLRVLDLWGGTRAELVRALDRTEE